MVNDRNVVRNAHGLLLVVGNEQGGDTDLLLDTPDFLPRFNTELGVQV